MIQQRHMCKAIIMVALVAGICFATGVQIANPQPCIGIVGNELCNSACG